MAGTETPPGAQADPPVVLPEGGAAEPPAKAAQESVAPSLLSAAKVEEPAKTEGEAKPAVDAQAKPDVAADAQAQAAAEAAKTPEGEAPPAEPEPVKYTDFTLPEGFEANPEVLGKYTETLAKHRAPQELGQDLLNLHIAEMQQAAQLQLESWNTLQQNWLDEVKADKAIGGENLPGVLSSAARVMDEYGSPELREALTLTGAGNHPAVIRFFNNVSKALKEGSPVPAVGGPVQQPKSRAERRYGKGA